MYLRIAQIMTTPVKGDLATNSRRLMTLLDELAPRRPDVVVTPECYLDGYATAERSLTQSGLRELAVDPATSPFIDPIREWARAHSAWIILGASRLAPEGLFNSALLYDRTGGLAGAYDKVHGVDDKYVAGNRLPVFASDFGHFGVMICADRRWPETVRALALQGARVIFNPTYGNYGEMNNCLMRTRSLENEVFIAFTHPAQALVTGPRGRIIADHMSISQRWAVTEIDLDEVDAKRASPQSFLRGRRPEVYGNSSVEVTAQPLAPG